MNRLNRLVYRLPNYFRRKSIEYRKEFKEMAYDIKHVPKSSLLNVYGIIVTITTIGTTITYMVYNTYYKEKLTEVVLLKVGDRPVLLNDNLELLAIREWNGAHVARSYKLMGLLKYFPCKGSDIMSYGDLMSRTGVDVGLPHNFTYNSVDDVKLNEVTVFGQSLTKDSVSDKKANVMKKLIESLVFSENAKKFAITREIHFADRYRVITEGLNIGFSTMAAVGVGQQLILKMNIRRKYVLSFLFRCCSLVLGIGFWFLIRQIYTYQWNLEADQLAVAQGKDYYDGAIEYYEKLIERNKALYRLLGVEGPNRYTKGGEPKGMFTSVPSLKKRLEKIKELEPETQESDTNETNSESNK